MGCAKECACGGCGGRREESRRFKHGTVDRRLKLGSPCEISPGLNSKQRWRGITILFCLRQLWPLISVLYFSSSLFENCILLRQVECVKEVLV